MARLIKTQAIILKKRELLNKDRMITLFSEEVGKLNVVAKGIKKITSRRLPHTETANLINVILHRQNDRYYLQGTELISAFSQIKKNNQKVSILYLYFLILERILPENEKEILIYHLTKQFLVDLSKNNFTQINLTSYLNKLLTLSGFLHENKLYNDLIPFIEEIINEKITQVII